MSTHTTSQLLRNTQTLIFNPRICGRHLYFSTASPNSQAMISLISLRNSVSFAKVGSPVIPSTASRIRSSLACSSSRSARSAFILRLYARILLRSSSVLLCRIRDQHICHKIVLYYCVFHFLLLMPPDLRVYEYKLCLDSRCRRWRTYFSRPV